MKEIMNYFKKDLLPRIKQGLALALQYYKENLRPKLREGLKLAVKAFYTTLWFYIKEEVLLTARKSLGLIETYLHSDSLKEKKQAVIELIMTRIKLPFIFKPFKRLICNIISSKIDEILEDLLGKGFELVG